MMKSGMFCMPLWKPLACFVNQTLLVEKVKNKSMNLYINMGNESKIVPVYIWH